MLGELMVPKSLIRSSAKDRGFADEVTESYLLRGAGRVDHVAARDDELLESIESKHQVGLLFEAIGKLDVALGGVLDREWVKEHFTEMLQVRKYALMKTCPRGPATDFDFEPTIYEEKVYHRGGGGSHNIEVRACSDDSLITTLTGHTRYVSCLIIDDGKLYSGSGDRTIKIWNCSTDTLI